MCHAFATWKPNTTNINANKRSYAPDGHVIRCSKGSHLPRATRSFKEFRSQLRVTREDCHGCYKIESRF